MKCKSGEYKHIRLSGTGLVALALLLGFFSNASATPINLGNADPSFWTVLSLGGELRIEGGTTNITGGNVGVLAPGPFRTNKSHISGDVYLNTPLAPTTDADTTIGGVQRTGGTAPGPGAPAFGPPAINPTSYPGGGPPFATVDQLLAAAKRDAIDFSTFYGGLACTICGLTEINDTSATINLGPGQNVINLTSLNMKDDTLTFNTSGADATTRAIVNVMGPFLFSQSQVTLGSGLDPLEVLFNLPPGFTGDVDIKKGTTGFQGIVLAPGRDITVTDELVWNGSIIGDPDTGNFIIHSGADVNGPPPSEVPQPSTLLLLGSGLVGLLLWSRRRK